MSGLNTGSSIFVKWPKYLAGATPKSDEKYEKNFMMFSLFFRYLKVKNK